MRSKKSLVLLLVLVVLGGLFIYFLNSPSPVQVISYSELINMADSGQNIQSITITDLGEGQYQVKGSYKVPIGIKKFFESSIGAPEIEDLNHRLLVLNPRPPITKTKATSFFPIWLVIILLIMITMVGVMGGMMRMSKNSSGNSGNGFGRFGDSSFPGLAGRKKHQIALEDVKKFSDVAGCDEAKEELAEIIDFLGYPYKYTRLGGRIPKGVLLYGPPGVGKTLLAKAVAGEANVPFLKMAGSEFVEMFVGVGASRVRELFNQARSNPPCIVFIDEIDAIGRRSAVSNMANHSEDDKTLNQILVEMDGFESSKGIIVMAATNREDKLDEALLRPGRFDRKIHVQLPDIKGREEILKIHTRKVRLDDHVDLKMLARMTPGYSGADLANLVNEAALKAGKNNKESVSMKEFESSREKILMGRENRSLSSVMTEEEKRVTAVHEAGHALVAVMIPGSDPLYKVSIIPRGRALGVTSQLPEKDRYNVSQEYLMENLSILFGGRVAENKIFGKLTAGAQNDIERATELARTMVCELGMSELGPINFNPGQKTIWPNQSEETRREIDVHIRQLIEKAYGLTKAIIDEHETKLRKIADALIEKESLEREEIEALVKEF